MIPEVEFQLLTGLHCDHAGLDGAGNLRVEFDISSSPEFLQHPETRIPQGHLDRTQSSLLTRDPECRHTALSPEQGQKVAKVKFVQTVV